MSTLGQAVGALAIIWILGNLLGFLSVRASNHTGGVYPFNWRAIVLLWWYHAWRKRKESA